MGDDLAGIGLLIRGRHDLYVSSLAALLESRGAKVWLSPPESEIPARRPRATQLIVLESPLPSELHKMAALGLPVIVLAERAAPEDQLAAAQLGAHALLAKNATLAELMVSIKRAAADPEGDPGILSPQTRHRLTPRQREVLGLIVEGLDNKEIAGRLGISERTARAHVSAVLERLGAANRTQAAVAAIQRGLLAVLLVLGGMAAAAATAEVASAAPRVGTLARSVGGSSGVWAYDTTSGRRLASFRAGTRRTPASVEKLLTSATALDKAGPAAQIHTTALMTGTLADGELRGDLYIRGHGDPSLGYAALGRLARDVKKAGVNEVTGRVYGDESYFDSRRGGPASGFATDFWVGPLSGLAFNEGLMRPFGSGFQRNPPQFVAERFAAKLKAVGVRVAGGARTGVAPAEAALLATVWSPPLAALLAHMNTVSDNYYAETLIKAIGAAYGQGGSTANGAAVVRAFTSGLGFSSRVVDGSGLSYRDAISPSAIGRLLLGALQKPWFDAFYRSLPLAGVSGTLKKRMRGTAAAGRCRAKTGTLIAVSALAGYCRSRSGHRIAFAILMNRVNIAAAHQTQDRIAASLAAYRG
ncbi:MAG: D-alanyl-D-alanine carboxypeptidase/D-alanyl-D-alanine-endopeptidase [Candidatus Rokuibacteriota bacterium]|nr:MAG: D-alanyl-D-alanine carboxypeptidase/D-alanyl-D-alanine-endopeptidase [Candidatus Rokubacteria bacterium]